jgi:hydrogenase maturation protease
VAESAVICVGNRTRSDDAVGLVIADELAAHHPDLPLRLSGGEPGELIDLWSGLTRVVMVDAVLTGKSKPGTIHVLEVGAEPLQMMSPTSSHGIGVVETIELARALHRLPADLRLVGIEPGSLVPGTDLTPAVELAVPDAIARILKEIADA